MCASSVGYDNCEIKDFVVGCFKKLDSMSLDIFAVKKQCYQIALNLNSKRTIGSCTYQKGVFYFNFNYYLLSQATKDEILELVKHEYAHMLTRVKYGSVAPHGKEWKYIMRKINGKLNTAKTEIFTKYKLNPTDVVLKCGCRSINFSKSQAKKLIQKGAYCGICNKKFKQKEEK